METVENNSPIVILGCPRSGTTLLRLMLTSHPEICIPHEFPLIQKTIEYFKDNEKVRPIEFVDFLESYSHYRDWGIEPDDLVESLRKSVSAPDAYINIVYREYSIKMGNSSTTWGDKNIGNIALVDEIINLFPSTKFIYLLRDPRDIYASFKTKKWQFYTFPKDKKFLIDNPIGGAKIWEYCINQYNTKFKNNSRSIILVRYDDLIQSPESTLKKIFQFVGKVYSAESLNYYKNNEEKQLIPKDRRDIYHENTVKPLDKNRIGSYQNILSKKEITIINQKLFNHLKNYNFSNIDNENIFLKYFDVEYYVRKTYLSLLGFLKSRIKRVIR